MNAGSSYAKIIYIGRNSKYRDRVFYSKTYTKHKTSKGTIAEIFKAEALRVFK